MVPHPYHKGHLLLFYYSTLKTHYRKLQRRTLPYSETTIMDPRIWSKLPPDVVEHILLLLPLKTLLNLRPTCKAFTCLLFSPSFVSKHCSSLSSSSLSPFSSFLLLSHPQFPHYFRLYDSNLCSWRTLSLSLSNSLPFSSSFTLVSSSGGLFCLFNPTSSTFLVYNLFVKSFRKIENRTHHATAKRPKTKTV